MAQSTLGTVADNFRECLERLYMNLWSGQPRIPTDATYVETYREFRIYYQADNRYHGYYLTYHMHSGILNTLHEWIDMFWSGSGGVG